MFKLFDKDNDELLSREELREALEMLFELQARNRLEMVPAPKVVLIVVVVVVVIVYLKIGKRFGLGSEQNFKLLQRRR